jgi:stage II sporulation protein AA (anti-sigma F factor antagonist)
MIAIEGELRLTQVERNGIVCLRPEGELDQATLEPLRARLDDLAGHGKTVRLDLGGLTFLATSGLGVLLDADAHARRCGQRLTFYHGRPEVERMLRLSGVDRLLSFEPGYQAASN